MSTSQDYPAPRLPSAQATSATTGGRFSAPATLSSLLRQRAVLTPAGVVVTFLREDGADDPVSFSSLDAAATAIASALTATSLPPGARILLPLLPGRDFLRAFWGVIRAGMIAVPVPPPVAGTHAERFAHIAADCSPALTLTSPELVPALGGPICDNAGAIITIDQLQPAEQTECDRSAGPGDPAYLQYTSGTTRPPRGAVITHTQALASAAMAADALQLTTSHVVLQWLPEWHDLGLLSQVLLPVYRPYGVHVMSPIAFAADPVRLLEEMSVRGAYGTAMPYGGYELLARRVARASAARSSALRLNRWQVALAGADTVDPARLREFAAVLSRYGMPGTVLHGAYGSAEANIVSLSRPGTGLTVIRADYQALVQDGKIVRAFDGGVELAGSGTPVDGMEVRILHPSGAECTEGVIGEIAVGGPGVTTTYWGQPAPTTLVNGRQLLLTGDLGAMLGGELFPLGRKADVIADKHGRSHPAWLIETAAARAHRSVRIPSLAAFESSGKSVLVAETRRGAGATDVATAICGTVCSRCGLWLDEVLIVPPKTIPLTTSGKVRRAAVRTLYENGQLTAPHLSEMAR